MQKLRVGITGAGGFIGSHLVDALGTDDVDLVLMSGPHGNVKNFPDAIVIDISNAAELGECLSNVDIVVHLAGLNSVRESFNNPAETLRVNTIGTNNLLSVCKSINISKVIIVSSAEVYGRPEFNPVPENTSLRPLSPYGVSKVAIEQLCYVHHVASGMNFKILRPFSIYGPRMSQMSLISEIYNRVKAGDGVTLFNCSSIRDYCYVGDLANAIRNAVLSSFNGFEVFNIASGVGTNSKQLAQTIQLIMGATGDILQNPLPDRPRNADVDNLVADISKAKKDLNWMPVISLTDGLTKTLKFFANE
jgi:UDP-glucose 4-epimerase